MFRQILVSTFLVSALGCGGVASEDTVNGVSGEQDKTEQLLSCSQMQGRVCSPGAEGACTADNGQTWECICQEKPFNKWVCFSSL